MKEQASKQKRKGEETTKVQIVRRSCLSLASVS